MKKINFNKDAVLTAMKKYTPEKLDPQKIKIFIGCFYKKKERP